MSDVYPQPQENVSIDMRRLRTLCQALKRCTGRTSWYDMKNSFPYLWDLPNKEYWRVKGVSDKTHRTLPGLAVRRKSVSDTDLEGVQLLILVPCYPEIVHLPGALNSAPHDHSMCVTLTCRKTCALCPCGHRENALPTLLSPHLPVLLSDSLHYYILAASEAAPHRAKGPSGKRGASVWSQNWKSRAWGEG